MESFSPTLSPYAPPFPLPKDDSIHLTQLHEWLQDMENIPYETMKLEFCQRIYHILLSFPSIMILYPDLRHAILERTTFMEEIIQSRVVQLHMSRWEARFQEDMAEIQRSIVCSELQSVLISQIQQQRHEIYLKHTQYVTLLASFDALKTSITKWSSHPQWVA
jgi:hypothetical protein